MVDNKLFEDRFKVLCIFSLEKNRLRKDAIPLFKYLKGHHNEVDQDLSSLILEGRTKRN